MLNAESILLNFMFNDVLWKKAVADDNDVIDIITCSKWFLKLRKKKFNLLRFKMQILKNWTNISSQNNL